MFDWFMLRSTHDKVVAALSKEADAADRRITDLNYEVARSRENNLRANQRAEALQAQLDAITSQRRTAAAKGRETQRARRLAANGANQ